MKYPGHRKEVKDKKKTIREVKTVMEISKVQFTLQKK